MNLAQRTLEVFREPKGGRYPLTLVLREPGAVIALQRFPDVKLRLDAIIQ